MGALQNGLRISYLHNFCLTALNGRYGPKAPLKGWQITGRKRTFAALKPNNGNGAETD